MLPPEDSATDVFLPSGTLSSHAFSPEAAEALHESIRFTRETRWGSVRSPHVFMGLLALPSNAIQAWGERIGANLARLLTQFRELFHQDPGERDAPLCLNREFFSDNTIRLLRDAVQRARSRRQARATSMDLLISLLTANNSIVAECFERIGVTPAKLTEMAMLAEKEACGEERPSSSS